MIGELSPNPLDHEALPLQFMMVTGTSGSGKTQALKCLEDLGFFCVDNLPPALFQKFTELCAQPGKDVKKVALGIDIRERAFFDDLLSNLEALQANGCHVELLFLEAQDDILVRRFSESRRPHPLLPQRPVIEGIQLERERLQGLRSRAHRVLDTSEFSVHDLKAWMIKHYRERDADQSLKISLLSFGYKYGIPVDVDMVFDVRFLRNPHFVPELQPLTGEHTEIQQFVLDNKEGQDFLGHLRELFAFLLPLFEREQRSYLTIAFGCTGGRHRSVSMALYMRDILETLGYKATLRHREIQQEHVETS
ncbi:MAG: RNase adapter RapZ [Nitrospirota bacterium]|nr:RNase adapter RapZ [Nitrospirota bacterium]MDH5588162.1 RNase adapter RapZ [Nitrospirota bacterium]MDH5776423.1 RNase adapter RapZ [Nitrospirota bacterium]